MHGTTHTEIPDTCTVMESRVELSDLAHVANIPDIVTVITVHHRELEDSKGGRG